MNSVTSDEYKTNNPDLSPQEGHIQSTLQALRKLLEGDEQEQKETLQYLKKALDVDRPSERKLFK